LNCVFRCHCLSLLSVETTQVPVKLLFIPSWYPAPSHPELGVFVRKQAEAISEFYDVTVLYFDFNKGKNARRTGLTMIRLSPSLNLITVPVPEFNFPLGGMMKMLWVWIRFLKLKYSGQTGKYDGVVLDVVYHMGLFLFPFLRFSGKPLYIIEHWTGYFDEDGTYKKFGVFIKWQFKAIFKKAQKIIAISEPIAERLNFLFRSGNKTSIVYNILDIPQKSRDLADLDKNHFHYTAISNFNNRQKGLTGIIDAFERLYQESPDIRLTMVGDGADLDLVKQYANKKLFPQGVVEFTGRISNDRIPEVYRKTHCYVLNSNFETFSISTAEAILHGVPVVATRCHGPEEFVNDSNGKIIEKGNTEELYNAMKKIKTGFSSYNPVTIRDGFLKNYSTSFRDAF